MSAQPPPPTAPIALTLGDPAGIGPELIAEAWTARAQLGLPPMLVVGSAGLIAAAAARRGLALRTIPIADPRDAAQYQAQGLPVIEVGACDYNPGEPSRAGAELALSALRHALAMVCNGTCSAIVTGPVAKASIAAIEPGFIGQTEACADACGIAREDAVMMLAGPSLRTVPLTVHLALAEVPGRLSSDLIVRRARIVDATLRRDFGIAHPRLAVAGLNPHAGEGGAFGDEEARIIAPAIAALRSEGIHATGPHPADALFAARARASYDAALCMYHDQALIPLKTLDFDSGVNVTLGLPIVRTSPDHGTAFAIAGKRVADPGAMVAAIRMAAEMAARRTAHG